MARTTAMDLTKGRPIRQILLFSLPLVAGTLFQQLYSFVDTIMVGRLIGEDALAAVGTTYSLHFLTLGFVQGACVGFAIPLAQAIGAQDARGFRRYFWNGVWLCTALAAVMTALTFALAGPLLTLIQTPAEIFADARRYDRIRAGIKAGLCIQWIYCAAAWAALFFGKRPFTALVLGPGEGEAAALSVQYLAIISTLFCIHGSLMIFRNTLQGMGYSLHAVLSGVGELLGRALGSALAVATPLGFVGVCLANPLAWGLALCYCIGMTTHFLRRRESAAQTS